MKKTEFNIRQATKQDIPLLLELIKELARYEDLLDQVEATEDILYEWIFEKEKAEALIAQHNDKPIGFALYFHNFSTFVGKAGIYLEDLFVYPDFRGKGYGKALLKEVARIAAERKCGRLEWACLDWNKPSIDFYLSLGAHPQNDWTVYRMNEEELREFACRDN